MQLLELMKKQMGSEYQAKFKNCKLQTEKAISQLADQLNQNQSFIEQQISKIKAEREKLIQS